MNDFTKDELKSIESDIMYVRASTNIIDWDEPLLVKIKLMIHSYCEHEFFNPCLSCNCDKAYCVKCQRTLI